MNPLEYLNNRYLENLPQNFTVNLVDKSSFTKWIQERNYNDCRFKYLN